MNFELSRFSDSAGVVTPKSTDPVLSGSSRVSPPSTRGPASPPRGSTASPTTPLYTAARPILTTQSSEETASVESRNMGSERVKQVRNGAENLAESSSFGEGEKSDEENKMLGDRDIRYPVLENMQDDDEPKEGFDEGEDLSASPLSPWDLGGLNSGSVEGRGFNSDPRASSGTSSGASLNSVTSSRTPSGALFGTQDSPNPGTFSNRVTSQRSIVTSSMSMTSVGGEGRSSSGTEWGKELWESLQIGTQPPHNNNPNNGQSEHNNNNNNNNNRRPNNRFNIDTITTASSISDNAATFLPSEKSLYEDDVDEGNKRQNDLVVGGQPAVRIKEEHLEPELGLQFPLGDPIVGSAVQDLDISLVDPTTEPSYRFKTTHHPSQTTDPLETNSFESSFHPRRTTIPPQTRPTQPVPATPDFVQPSNSSLISSGSSSTTLSPAPESTTLRKSTPTPQLTSPPNSPTPQLATTISDSRSPPRYNDIGPFLGAGQVLRKRRFLFKSCSHF